MKGLPAILRQLADLAESNGGELPEDLVIVPGTKAEKKARKAAKSTNQSLSQRIVQKHFYGTGKG